jgi:type IV secretion system protein VirB11
VPQRIGDEVAETSVEIAKKLADKALGWEKDVPAFSSGDRILVGEVRDGSALELLKAWNTGHPGGMATIHANDTAAMLDRICQLIEEVVYPAPRLLVAQTVNICVHIRRDNRHQAGRSLSGIDRVKGIDVGGRWLLEPMGHS